MKKVLKPFSQEECIYYSDFSGKCFGQFNPPAEVCFSFNYGSSLDGETFKFHLTNEESVHVLTYIANQIKDEKEKNIILNKIELASTPQSVLKEQEYTVE